MQLAFEMTMSVGGQRLVIDAEDHGLVDTGRRRGNDDALGARSEMRTGLGLVREDAGAFQRDHDAQSGVRQIGGVALGRDLDALAVDDQSVAIDRDLARPAAMHAVALEEQRIGLGIAQVVDRHQLEIMIGPLQQRARHEAADPSEAVDSNLDGHGLELLFLNWTRRAELSRAPARCGRRRQAR